MPVNKIITRGMGPSRGGAFAPQRAGMVTQGFGGLLTVVAEQAVRLVRLGQSGTKRALREMEDVIVWAGLMRVNDERPQEKIQGFTTVKVNRSRHLAVGLVEGVSSRVRKAWEDVKITVKRIK